MFKRTRYQHGSLEREERKKGPAVWVYRWWEDNSNGKLIHRKLRIGDIETYPTESAAQAAAGALRLTINNACKQGSLQRTSINTLWEHYSREELPLKALSTQDSYITYAKNWILPRWGNMPLDQVKTVEVERWLRATDMANGTKAKIKCIMSALFSHAVRWEFCGHNPISSGIPVGTGGKRGPSTGVRVSAKRRKSPLKLTAAEVALVLTELEFRDQLLVFLDAGLGTRRGELAALRWMDCDFHNQVFDVQHSYYWRRGGHLIDTKSEASAQPLPMHPALRAGLLEWRSLSLYNRPEDFLFPSERLKGRKPLDLASVLKRKVKPAFDRIGIKGVGWHTFRHTVGTIVWRQSFFPLNDNWNSRSCLRDMSSSRGCGKRGNPAGLAGFPSTVRKSVFWTFAPCVFFHSPSAAAFSLLKNISQSFSAYLSSLPSSSSRHRDSS